MKVLQILVLIVCLTVFANAQKAQQFSVDKVRID